MSRSYKKAIIKDKKPSNNMYHKKVRRVSKQALREGKEIPDAKVIVNDYDYHDRIWLLEWYNKKGDSNIFEPKEKYRRK